MEDHIEESALSLSEDLGNARHRIREECPLPNNAESPGPLRDQHVTPGKERNGPWVVKSVRHCHDAVVVEGGPEDRRLAGDGDYDEQEKPSGRER